MDAPSDFRGSPKSSQNRPSDAKSHEKRKPRASKNAPQNQLVFRTSFLMISHAFLVASWLHFSCIFMIFASIFDPNIVNPGRRPRKRNMPNIDQDLPIICQESAKICQKLSETKCAHTTLRTETTDASTQELPEIQGAAVTAARHRSMNSAAPPLQGGAQRAGLSSQAFRF